MIGIDDSTYNETEFLEVSPRFDYVLSYNVEIFYSMWYNMIYTFMQFNIYFMFIAILVDAIQNPNLSNRSKVSELIWFVRIYDFKSSWEK